MEHGHDDRDCVDAWTPAIAALVIAWRWPSAGGVRRLLKPLTRWRIHVGWYLVAILGPIPLLLLADLIYVALGGAAPQQWIALPSGTAEGGLAAIPFTIGAIVAGALGEELGWRGFGQPRLQRSVGALGAAIVIGILWSTWHLWSVAVPGGLSLFSWTDFPQTYLRLTSTAILYAWLLNGSRGSLLLVLVAHGAFNLDTSSGRATTIVAQSMRSISSIRRLQVPRFPDHRNPTGAAWL